MFHSVPPFIENVALVEWSLNCAESGVSGRIFYCFNWNCKNNQEIGDTAETGLFNYEPRHIMTSENSAYLQGGTEDRERWESIIRAVSPEYRFLDQHWYSVWGRDYAANNAQLLAVTYSENDNPLVSKGIFPVVVRRLHGISVLSMAGYYYPFRSFICNPEYKDHAAIKFVDTVKNDSSAQIVQLGRLQATDVVCDALDTAFRDRKWKVCKIRAGNQQIVKLPASVPEFRAGLSRNLRKNHDRRKRQLEAKSGFEIAYYTGCDKATWERVINQCAEVESRSWLNIEGQNTRVYESEAFWKSYSADQNGSNRLAVCVLTMDAKPIAYSLAIDSGKCRYSISGQYDVDYKKLGVGIIADMVMFEQAIESGLEVVNMGEGEWDYKSRWGAEPGPALQSYYMFRPGLIGFGLYSMFVTVNHLRKSSLFSWLNKFF